jgi:hypothetical protein
VIDLTEINLHVVAPAIDPVVVCAPNLEAEVRRSMAFYGVEAELLVDRYCPVNQVIAFDRGRIIYGPIGPQITA